jgi:hypothetical protein
MRCDAVASKCILRGEVTWQSGGFPMRVRSGGTQLPGPDTMTRVQRV